METEIKAINDETRLEELLEHAATCRTLELVPQAACVVRRNHDPSTWGVPLFSLISSQSTSARGVDLGNPSLEPLVRGPYNVGSLRGLAEPAGTGRGSVFARERCILPSTWTETDPTRNAQREKLVETLRGYGRVAVAFSGGIDSTVVAQAAYEALGDAAIAVTAVSESLAAGELEEAQELARQIGIRHRVIRTEEFADPNYLRNNTDRCYFCKSELYGRLSGLLGELGVDVIASGANTDDMGDHRPGMRAAGEHGVRHPLQECGLSKADVRALARAWGLPTWDKPATPCLSSRIAYGEDVTPERVRMIDQAEQWLRQRGLAHRSGSATTRATWPGSRSPSTTCPAWSSWRSAAS